METAKQALRFAFGAVKELKRHISLIGGREMCDLLESPHPQPFNAFAANWRFCLSA
jgi:hypothetical protein